MTTSIDEILAMRTWREAILLNLAIAVGLGVGYGAWGWRLATLEGEVKVAQTRADQIARERDACFAGVRAGEQLWEGRGIVRAVYPRLLIVTHEEIPGLLPARTTGFHLADPGVPGRARAGDPIHFWLEGVSDNNTLVKVEPW
jgi:Copper binding periplasmic protein CusF